LEKEVALINADGREKWTLSEWKQKDIKGLIALKSTDPEAYKKLYTEAGINY
jgi:hypothetical protein